MRYFQDKTDVALIESPMTKLINSSINEILSAGKSAILEFPANYTNQTLIMAYQYVYTNKKTATILTNPKTIDDLNNDYYLIREGSVPLILRVPIGIRDDSGVRIKVNFPKGAIKKIKGGLKQEYEKALMGGKPVIVLASDVDHKEIKGGLLRNDFKRSGLAIFNNTFFSSEDKILKLVEWCKENGLQFLILVNSLSSDFHKKIGKETIVLPLSRGLLRELSIVDESLNSTFKDSRYKRNSKILSKFSIDQPFHYKSRPTIDYIEIENGLVLNRCANEMSEILNSMNVKSMVLKNELIQLVRIAYNSINSFVPIDRITRYSRDAEARVNGEHFCEIISKLAKWSDTATYEKSKNLIATFMTIWNCLDRCKTPFYDRGYTKENKFSVLVEEIRKNLNYHEKIFVLPTNKQDLNQLNKLLKILFPENMSKIAIMPIVNLTVDAVENSMAILPGNPKTNELYILNYPFKKIEILVYHGDNIAFTKDFVSIYARKDSCNSIFSECIVNVIEQVPGVRNHLSHVPLIEKYAMEVNVESDSILETEVISDVNDGVADKPLDLKDFLDGIDRYEKIEKEYEEESLADYVQNIKKSSAYYVLILENPYTGQRTVSYSALKTPHTFYTTGGKLDEHSIEEGMEGSMIVKAPRNQNDLLEILLDLYGFKDRVDYEIINIWKECTSSFENSNQAASSIYGRYCELGGTKKRQTVNTWFNGKIMGPNNKKDLEIIGAALDNDDLMTNADYIFDELERIRYYKRSLGRRLNKIIAAIIQQDQVDADDPFSEMIRENVKDYLFVVKEIHKINAEGDS